MEEFLFLRQLWLLLASCQHLRSDDCRALVQITPADVLIL
jgi:hypothetical protein